MISNKLSKEKKFAKELQTLKVQMTLSSKAKKLVYKNEKAPLSIMDTEEWSGTELSLKPSNTQALQRLTLQ